MYNTENRGVRALCQEWEKGAERWYQIGEVGLRGARTTPGFTPLGSNLAISTDGNALDVGVKYTFGPNSVSAAYFTAEVEGSVAIPGDDEVDTIWLGYRRNLGPGVQWRNTLAYVDWDDETDVSQNSSDGWAVSTSIFLAF